MRLTSRAFLDTPSDQAPHVKLAALEGAADGLIALTGGPGGPLDLALAAGQAELAAARCARLAALFGDRLYVELQRHGRPEEKQVEPGLLDLAYANGIAARRDQRAVLRAARGLRGARCADLHRRRAARRRVRAAAAFAGALLQVARRDGGAVRRSARGARLDGRDRAALRVPAEDAQADPAALHRAGRLARSTRPPSCAGRPTRGSTRRIETLGLALGADHRRLPQAARFRARA